MNNKKYYSLITKKPLKFSELSKDRQHHIKRVEQAKKFK